MAAERHRAKVANRSLVAEKGHSNHVGSGATSVTRAPAAHTIPRELRAVKAYGFDPERFRDLGVPTLLLSGGDSPPALRKAAEAVDGTLPNSRIVVMAGHGHAAMDTATDLFTTEVLRFVEGPS